MQIIEHRESFEVRSESGQTAKQFPFDDNASRQDMPIRMPTRTRGLTWDEPTFREYIKDPKAKIPSTKTRMSKGSMTSWLTSSNTGRMVRKCEAIGGSPEIAVVFS
jgi:hypothetical protein